MRKLRTSCGILQFGHVINNRGLADMVTDLRKKISIRAD